MWQLIVTLTFEQKIVCGALLFALFCFGLYFSFRKPKPFSKPHFGISKTRRNEMSHNLPRITKVVVFSLITLQLIIVGVHNRNDWHWFSLSCLVGIVYVFIGLVVYNLCLPNKKSEEDFFDKDSKKSLVHLNWVLTWPKQIFDAFRFLSGLKKKK